MNRLPRWFWLSLLHPLFSVLGFTSTWVMLGCSQPGDRGLIHWAYEILHYVLIANIPGHFLLLRLYEAPDQPLWAVYVICLGMVALTWVLCVLPFCWCLGNCCRWLRY